MKSPGLWVSALAVCLFGSGGLLGQQIVTEADSTAEAAARNVPRLLKFSGSAAVGASKSPKGTVQIAFSLYQDQEGGSPLWQETQTVRLDGKGRYNVLLGATESVGLPVEPFASGEARWLGVQVQGQPEQPRTLLVSVPYAMRAEDAETLAGKPASEYVSSSQLEEEVRRLIEEATSLSGPPDPGAATHERPAAQPRLKAAGTSQGSEPRPAAESPQSWLEDFGTAPLRNGVAEVALAPAFLGKVDTQLGYQVFLTPGGDSQGLYVAWKTPARFEVRERSGGKSNIAFDYRIVAKSEVRK